MCRPVRKMIQWRVIIGASISPVLGAGVPVEAVFALDHAASKPVEPHIHGLGALGYNVFIGDSHGGGIFGLDGIPPLGAFHFDESLA